MVKVQSVIIKPFSGGGYWSSSVLDAGWMTVVAVRNCVVCTLSSLLQHHPVSYTHLTLPTILRV